MAPASRRRATSGASRLGRPIKAVDPARPGRPIASMLSLMRTGTPCRGPRSATRRAFIVALTSDGARVGAQAAMELSATRLSGVSIWRIRSSNVSTRSSEVSPPGVQSLENLVGGEVSEVGTRLMGIVHSPTLRERRRVTGWRAYGESVQPCRSTPSSASPRESPWRCSTHQATSRGRHHLVCGSRVPLAVRPTWYSRSSRSARCSSVRSTRLTQLIVPARLALGRVAQARLGCRDGPHRSRRRDVALPLGLVDNKVCAD